MTPERWQQVEEIFQSALDLSPGERASFIAESCTGDDALRAQVEALVAQYDEAGDFIEAPILDYSGFGLGDFPVPNTQPMTESELLTGRLIGAYKFVRELGRGGMGTVYLAVRADSAFRKSVAIKLVKRGMDTDFILRRFRNERQILATLDHPNIARLLDGGTTDDGLPYFIMEYIEGQPLYYYCDVQKLNTAERLHLFCQICSAVAYAHRSFVVHRDIKPSNILVASNGSPKLLDFGIAKLLNPELASDIFSPTATAMRLMTPEYASPEQVRGEPVTPATDIYSLGVLLYELLTGHRPYRLRHRASHEVARVICETDPTHPSVIVTHPDDLLQTDAPSREMSAFEFLFLSRGASPESLRRELAGNLDNIILKCLRKEPEGRYASVEHLCEDITRHLEGRPVFATAYRPAITQAVEAAATKPTNDEESIAVLPLKMLNPVKTDDTGDDYLGIGLADALITRLSNVRSFAVRPTSAVARFSQMDCDPLEVGRELGVGFVLDGRIQKSRERIRVTVQLVSVRHQAPVWAGKFDDDYRDILDIQDSISEQVSEALVPHLTTGERQRLSVRGTNNIEAYEAYLRGRYHWNTFTEEGFAKALTCYYRAIALDPDYALAYTGIADYYNWIGVYAVLPFAESSAAAKEAATKAVELDDTLAEAHSALGFSLLVHDFDWRTADAHHQRAFALNPNYAVGVLWYGYQLTMQGRFEEGIIKARRALELDPFSAFFRHSLGWSYYHARRFEESIAENRKLVAAEPNYAVGHYLFSWLLRHVGAYEEAISEAEKAVALFGRVPYVLTGLGATYAAAGKTGEAQQVLNEINELAKYRYVSPYHLALLYLNLGDKERAFNELERAYAIKDGWLVWLNVEPQLDPLRADARFVNLLRALGFAN
ncbi:MAG: protein kinase [Pyrinomonadaceae bacterium]|nr:protein kinase [Pyrinomonadaceae bacterium]